MHGNSATRQRSEAPGAAYSGGMFERFTERARKVVVLAQEEARLLNHNYIGTEHILLGLIREGNGVAAQVLMRLGADLSRVRQEVIQLLSGHAATQPESEPALAEPPRCGRCGASLKESTAYHVVNAAGEHEGDEPVRFVVVYCKGCGTALGTAS